MGEILIRNTDNQNLDTGAIIQIIHWNIYDPMSSTMIAVCKISVMNLAIARTKNIKAKKLTFAIFSWRELSEKVPRNSPNNMNFTCCDYYILENRRWIANREKGAYKIDKKEYFEYKVDNKG